MHCNINEECFKLTLYLKYILSLLWPLISKIPGENEEFWYLSPLYPGTSLIVKSSLTWLFQGLYQVAKFGQVLQPSYQQYRLIAMYKILSKSPRIEYKTSVGTLSEPVGLGNHISCHLNTTVFYGSALIIIQN